LNIVINKIKAPRLRKSYKREREVHFFTFSSISNLFEATFNMNSQMNNRLTVNDEGVQCMIDNNSVMYYSNQMIIAQK
ncbi:hypothetical protein BCV71DRAFT_270914, partial [Rhizopus microsporus]